MGWTGALDPCLVSNFRFVWTPDSREADDFYLYTTRSIDYGITSQTINKSFEQFLEVLSGLSLKTMSRASKLTLAGASLFAITTVIFVHHTQSAEKAVCNAFCPFLIPPHLFLLSPPLSSCSPHKQITNYGTKQAMHAGVIRDMQQQQIKKERQLDFEMQKALEEEYKKVQTVRDGGGG